MRRLAYALPFSLVLLSASAHAQALSLSLAANNGAIDSADHVGFHGGSRVEVLERAIAVTPEPEGPVDDGVDDAGAAAVQEEDTAVVAAAPDDLPTSRATPGLYNAHGVGVRTGLTLVPTWILAKFLASHTNSLCRGEAVGGFAADRGLTKQDGCNFYVGGEYIYRKSRIFDIVATVGYQRARLPDGLWLDKDEWADSCESHDGEQCNLSAADYTEVDMGFVFVQADFIGRLPIVRTPDYELSVGGGGGIGLGIIVGDGVHQTPLGSAAVQEGTCRTLDDLSDFTKCTPHWMDDPDIDQDGDGSAVDNPPSEDQTQGEGLYADCSEDDCSVADLNAFGSRVEQEDVPPVVPVINIIVSARLIVKDSLGLVLSGGFNTGFYFGGGLQYFFGGGGK